MEYDKNKYKVYTWKKILIAIPIWTIGGLGFGYFVKLFANKKGTPADSSRPLEKTL